jgi:sugar/nucleoside kinase (ribokinase family)
MLRGLFVGLTTIDIQYLIDTFPTSNSKTVASIFAMSVGGPATNAALTFAYLGGKSHLISAIGKNQFVPFIESELQRYNMEFTDLSPAANQIPTVSSILTTKGSGHRAIITTKSSIAPSAKDATFIANKDNYSLALVDGFNMETCCRVAMQAQDCGIAVVLDGGSWKDGMERLLPYVDVAICSENFHSPEGIDENTVIEYLASQGVKYRAITRGERSIIYSFPDGRGEITIEPVEVVDTSGAGDILHGAFCYYYAKGNNFVQALLKASKVATLSCRTFGTRSWMQDKSEGWISSMSETQSHRTG